MLKIMINSRIEEEEVVAPETRKKLKELIRLAVESELELSEGKEISLTFMDNQEIKDLNAKYREKNEPTDVLAFPLDEKILGEVIVSVEQAQKQAEDYGHSFLRELAFLVVHGALHLLGYDHKDEADRADMKAKENRYLQEFQEFRK